MSLCVWIGEEAALEQLIGRRLDAGHEVRRREGGLLRLPEEVIWIAIQDHAPDLVKRELLLGPHLGHVKDVKRELEALFIGHHLHADLPRGAAALSEVLKQIARGVVRIFTGEDFGVVSGEILDASLAFEVVLHPRGLACAVHLSGSELETNSRNEVAYPLERVRAKAVHVTKRIRSAAIGKQDQGLVGRLWGEREEVPERVTVLEIRLGVALLRVHQIGKELRVADEEHYAGLVSEEMCV